jgi:CHAT domain-containing protein/Flp pilus assembly protein TadD
MATWPVEAQTPTAEALRHWQSLNAEVLAAVGAGDYAKGIAVAEEALGLARQTFGDRGPQTLTSLNNLAALYYFQGRYREAEPLYRDALQASREVLGPRDPDTLASLNNLAELYSTQGRFGEAEPLFREALPAMREVLGSRHPDTLTSLNNLASLYRAQGRYVEAEPLYREALQARREVLGHRHPDTLSSLNSLASLYQSQGRYAEAEPSFREALQARREVLGPRHPNTLTSLNNLALLYNAQGRSGEAEPLFREALQASREVLGPHHPQTLGILNNLALLYDSQGRYGEAEPLYRETLQTRREVLGPRHPDTLTSLNNLAALYRAQGRYGEAEPLYREALPAMREVLGPRHPHALASLNNLAGLYQAQGRYGEAEPLFREALQIGREVLGLRHPDTVSNLNNLAGLYRAQGRDGEAEPLFREALQARREMLGAHHPDTLTSLNNLANLYSSQGRSGEAEPLLREVLQGRREVLGLRHPDTLASLNNLAFLYNAQGRYGEAEPLYEEALQGMREVLGPSHPVTLTVQLNRVGLLANLGRRADAIWTLQQMEPNLLGWIGQELYSTEAGAVRRQLVSSQATFQDMVLSLATAEGNKDARRLAGTVLLRFKVLQGEEEAYLARIARQSQDPRVQTLAGDIGRLRTTLVAAAQGAPDAFERMLQALEGKRRELIDVSPQYKNRLRVLTASLDDARKAMQAGTVLIEFRQFQQYNFHTRERSDPRFAAMLLTGSGEPAVVDLGPVSEVQALAAALDDENAVKLYDRLFAPFKDAVDAASSVYVAPDGILNLVPFARLKLPDGHYWAERQEVHVLQTGRDLLRPDAGQPARGLLALGGIDFGAAQAAAGDSDFFAATGADRTTTVRGTADAFRGGFAALPATAEEVAKVKALYQARFGDGEPAEIWSGAAATKARLMALKSPPRVLHLATHGFYRPNESREPMLLSGIALAGANNELAGTGRDGLLFALEAEGLNLDGTELVVLSACATARGDVDYSEGVFGLARALRTAGARAVLVTLWNVNDGQARDFMVDFYKNWLGQDRSDPARALRDTQLQWIGRDGRRDPRDWAPYVLIE